MNPELHSKTFRRMKKSGLTTCCMLGGLTLLLVSACSRKDVTVVDPDPVVIQVGGQNVRMSELQAQVDYWNSHGSSMPTDKQEFLERYVERLAALEKARELGLDKDLELKHQWENLLIGRLHESILNEKLDSVTVSDEELQTYYENSIKDFSKSAQLRLAMLYLGSNSKMSDVQREALRMRLKEALEMASELPEGTRGFGELAMTYSEEATSRFKGGDVGWLQAGQERYRWPIEVVEAGFDLNEVGDLSSVIETKNGFYLLMKLDGREASVTPLDGRLKDILHTRLINQKRAEVTASVKSTWQQGVPVSFNDDILSKLDFSPPSDNQDGTVNVTHMP